MAITSSNNNSTQICTVNTSISTVYVLNQMVAHFITKASQKTPLLSHQHSQLKAMPSTQISPLIPLPSIPLQCMSKKITSADKMKTSNRLPLLKAWDLT